MKKKLIYIIPSFSLVIISILTILLYLFIPRLTYTYNKEYKGYFVDKAYGISESYTIPSTYKNEKVVGIGIKAFYSNDKLKEIIFEAPENIKVISKEAFFECHNLSKIDLSKVEEIERNAFSYNESLKEITISAKNIGASAFYSCKALDTINLNEGISSIGSLAFAYANVTNITLPKSLANLYVDSLKYLEKLETLNVYEQNRLTSNSLSYLNTFKSIIKYI